MNIEILKIDDWLNFNKRINQKNEFIKIFKRNNIPYISAIWALESMFGFSKQQIREILK